MKIKIKDNGDVKLTLSIDQANFICALIGDTPCDDGMQEFFNVDSFDMYYDLTACLGHDINEYFDINFKEQE